MSIASRSVGLVAAAFLALFTLSACNTIEGVGEDLEAAGDSIENAAERNKDY